MAISLSYTPFLRHMMEVWHSAAAPALQLALKAAAAGEDVMDTA